MGAAEKHSYARIARLHRELADAYEELDTGKPKARRHRGPIRVDLTNVPEDAKRLAEAHLRKVGVR